MLSVVTGEDCGYVRGPFAATNDTVVIKLDCKESTPSSHYVSLQLRDNATHVAVQLVHCHTVPVGLFTNVTDNLTSLTVASGDVVQLLGRTFEGLGRRSQQVTDLHSLLALVARHHGAPTAFSGRHVSVHRHLNALELSLHHLC